MLKAPHRRSDIRRGVNPPIFAEIRVTTKVAWPVVETPYRFGKTMKADLFPRRYVSNPFRSSVNTVSSWSASATTINEASA